MPIKNIIPGQRVTKEKLHRARELRYGNTPAEKILWQEVGANQLSVHFRRHICPICEFVGLILGFVGLTSEFVGLI